MSLIENNRSCIGIVGGGFSGMLTAIQLIRHSTTPLHIVIISEKESFGKGIAFNTYSNRHLLNVPVAKMSALNTDPRHFLNWISKLPEYSNVPTDILANSFVPRVSYGKYLIDLWEEYKAIALKKNIAIQVYEQKLLQLSPAENGFNLQLETGKKLHVDYCVIATGNVLPRNPPIANTSFYQHPAYFQNPWDRAAVKNTLAQPVLIIGNGLTMVDTVIGLLENGFQHTIYSLSPHGFHILPHSPPGENYDGLLRELSLPITLHEVLSLVNKHVKEALRKGISPNSVIDSLRPHTQLIWRGLSSNEKKMFMARLRHLWGVARHRLPVPVKQTMDQLQQEGRLQVLSGKLIDIEERQNSFCINYFDKKSHSVQQLNVHRVINCTGPETAIHHMQGSFLHECLANGILCQDELALGINADPDTFQVINAHGLSWHNLFTIGSTLKGVLWESTAVGELRVQAEQVAKTILQKVNESSASTFSV